MNDNDNLDLQHLKTIGEAQAEIEENARAREDIKAIVKHTESILNPNDKAPSNVDSNVDSKKEVAISEAAKPQSKAENPQSALVKSKQETWILLDEFLKLSDLDRSKVQELIDNKSIKSKQLICFRQPPERPQPLSELLQQQPFQL